MHPAGDSFISRKGTLYQEVKKLNFSNVYGFLKEINAIILPTCVGLFSYEEIMKSTT